MTLEEKTDLFNEILDYMKTEEFAEAFRKYSEERFKNFVNIHDLNFGDKNIFQ